MTSETNGFDSNRIRKILILQLCPIGDTLFGTPAIRALRLRFPKARIVSLVWPVSCEVVKGNPNLDEVIVYEAPIGKLLNQLRKEGFDLVVELSNRGSWVTAMVGARYKVGFRKRPLQFIYHSTASVQRDMHAVDYCLDVVRPLGATLDDPRMEVFVGGEDMRQANALLKGHGVGPDDLLVAMHPGGKYFPAKRWSTTGFAEVADSLHREFGARIVTVGGSEDEELGRRIQEETVSAGIINLVGCIPIKQTIAVLKRANLFIGNDSSPMHMSVAVGTPVIALFGPTNPLNAKPYGRGHETIYKGSDMECSPCFHHNGNPVQYCPKCIRKDCMEAITPADVMGACRRLLSGSGWRNRKVAEDK